MESVSRNITDLAADERSVIEGLVGTRLSEDQRIVVQVLDTDEQKPSSPPCTIADYAILADLDDDEADRLTDAMLQRSPSRDIDLR